MTVSQQGPFSFPSPFCQMPTDEGERTSVQPIIFVVFRSFQYLSGYVFYSTCLLFAGSKQWFAKAKLSFAGTKLSFAGAKRNESQSTYI